MFPPIEDAVLQSNPDFAALYTTLTTAILNPNGATKNDPAAKERNATQEELKKHRLKAAKRNLLTNAIASATPPEPKSTTTSLRRPNTKASTRAPTEPDAPQQQLPNELLDLLLLLLPPLLSPPPSQTSKGQPQGIPRLLLTSPPLSNLPTLLPDLTPLLSTHLTTLATALARVANPTTNPSYAHRGIPNLPTHAATLQNTLSTARTQLSTARQKTSTELLALLRQHSTALTLAIRALEAKHGAVARALELRGVSAAQDASRAEVRALEALAGVRRGVYPEEAVRALEMYRQHLRDGRVRVGEGVRSAVGELEGYGVFVGDVGGDVKESGKGRTMREVARVWRDTEQQIAEVRADLARLERG